MQMNTSGRLAMVGFVGILSAPASGGCIGPVIMGQCEGQSVPWDTHVPAYREERPAPPGFYWDKRAVPVDLQEPGAVDPFTGRDAHDSDWYRSTRERDD